MRVLHAFAFGAVCSIATASFAAHSAVIGDFEDPTLDLWGTDGGPGTPTLSQGTVGVTLGTHSLLSANPQGSFWGPATGNLITLHRSDLQGANTISLDLTLIGTEINGDPAGDTTGFNGFAQSNEMAITLFSPAAGSNINLFIQKQFAGLVGAGISDSLGQNAGWNGVDGTRTLTWDLTKFTAPDPHDGQTKSISQFLALYPDIVDGKVAFVEQSGNGTATQGPARFYFDNVKLNGIPDVPEPASLGLILAGAPLLAVRRRRGN